MIYLWWDALIFWLGERDPCFLWIQGGVGEGEYRGRATKTDTFAHDTTGEEWLVERFFFSRLEFLAVDPERLRNRRMIDSKRSGKNKRECFFFFRCQTKRKKKISQLVVNFFFFSPLFLFTGPSIHFIMIKMKGFWKEQKRKDDTHTFFFLRASWITVSFSFQKANWPLIPHLIGWFFLSQLSLHLMSASASSSSWSLSYSGLKASFCPECGSLLDLPESGPQVICDHCRFACPADGFTRSFSQFFLLTGCLLTVIIFSNRIWRQNHHNKGIY